MWASIIGLVKAFFEAIPVVSKWFDKTAAEKEEEARKEVRDQVDHARKTGRPKWD